MRYERKKWKDYLISWRRVKFMTLTLSERREKPGFNASLILIQQSVKLSSFRYGDANLASQKLASQKLASILHQKFETMPF